MTAIERYESALLPMMKQAFEAQQEKMEEAARRIAESVMAGGMLYTFGTGHGHLLALEIFYRAGGLVPVCPMLDERLMLHLSASESSLWERKEGLAEQVLDRYPVARGDAVIIASNSGRNAVPVDMAALCRERGAYVIALTSLRHSTAVSPRCQRGKKLYEVADLVLDNQGVLGDACVEGAGGRMVGATSTAVGAAMLQGILCRVEEIARETGKPVPFFASSNIDGGDEINAAFVEAYRRRVPAL